MDLKLPITIIDELSETEVRSQGELDLASGEIRNVAYEDYDLEAEGLPADHEDYQFTVGVLRSGAREVEFRVDVSRGTGRYSVTPTELLELKGRAAKLFTQAPSAPGAPTAPAAAGGTRSGQTPPGGRGRRSPFA